MATEFTLLGDVGMTVDGQPTNIGHARQRCVLVALLVNANRVVRADQLVEQVWADRPPQSARSTVYSYLCRLRQCLAVAADVRLGRQPGGYLLAIDPLAVDLHRFRHLIDRARTVDDEQALSLFEQALALWHAEPFAHLETSWLAALRDRLRQERLAAEVDRNDLALRLGRHTGLLARLSDLAEEYPLDERISGHLIVALYHSGRQAEALARFQRVRQLLADEVGADPGVALQALHRQILMGEEILGGLHPAVAGTGPRPDRPPMPRQLPAPPPLFTGRTRELAGLDEAMGPTIGDATMAVLAISGTGGVGKTWLALRWAHDNADRFPDGQLHINLRGFDPSGQPVTPRAAVRSFLTALGVQPAALPADVDAQVALYRSLVAGRRMLILLDNARDADQVRPLLPGAADCAVIVTSRNRLTSLVAIDGAYPLALDLPNVDEARQLLARRLGERRTTAERDAVDRIVTGCARLPLALAIVAARAVLRPGLPLSAVAGELCEHRGRLDAFTDEDSSLGVRTVFSWSYRVLGPGPARLFRLLGLHPGPDISVPAAASLAGIPRPEARRLMAELTSAHLLTEQRGGRYVQHDLLRAYATELAGTDESDVERHSAARRLLDHYLHTAVAATVRLFPQQDRIVVARPAAQVRSEELADREAALAWFAAEHAVLVAVVRFAEDLGFDSHIWELARAMGTFLDRQGHWDDLSASQHAAMRAAQRGGDLPGEARTCRGLGRACARQGRHDDAHGHFQRARELYERHGDSVGQANTHLDRAWVCHLQHEHGGALDHANRALELYRAAGYQLGVAMALNDVGSSYARLGQPADAIDYCQQALALHQASHNSSGEADTWNSLGYIHHQLGDYPQAMSSYRRAVDLAQASGHRSIETKSLTSLGDSAYAAGDLDVARDAWTRALDILDKLHQPAEADEVRGRLRVIDGG